MKFGASEMIKWILLILPLIAAAIWLHISRARRLRRLIDSRVWKTVLPAYSARRIRRRTVLRLAALFCILLALTRPQWGFHWEEVNHQGLDILVVLDTSKSMLAEDIRPNRLQQAQWAVADFSKKLKGDRIGLVAFAGSSFLQCPATADYAAFNMMLNDLYAGIIPRGGTAIGQALETARESFDTDRAADRVIILITDGEDHEGNPMHTAEKLRDENIKLFCIGVGTTDGELIPSQNGYVKDNAGRVVKSSLNETLLEQLARTTGGFYVRSAPGDFGLDRIYKLGIAGLQRAEQETRLARVYEERTVWFAAAALLFLLAEGLFRPRAAVLTLLLFFLPKAEAADWKQAYKSGDYTNAVQGLEEFSQKFPDLGNYNRGCALYRMNDFQGSENAFAEAAAQTEDEALKQKALYNRGTSFFRSAYAALQNPETLQEAAGLAEQAAALFEEALQLDPDDLPAKKNLERALGLAVSSRIDNATRLINEANAMLTTFEAKTAKENYALAIEMLKPVLENLSPDSRKAEALTRHAADQIQMLERAVLYTRQELERAKKAIDAFEYQTAADIMLADDDARKFAFNLDEKLAENFQSFNENNRKVIQIVYPDYQPNP